MDKELQSKFTNQVGTDSCRSVQHIYNPLFAFVDNKCPQYCRSIKSELPPDKIVFNIS